MSRSSKRPSGNLPLTVRIPLSSGCSAERLSKLLHSLDGAIKETLADFTLLDLKLIILSARDIENEHIQRTGVSGETNNDICTNLVTLTENLKNTHRQTR